MCSTVVSLQADDRFHVCSGGSVGGRYCCCTRTHGLVIWLVALKKILSELPEAIFAAKPKFSAFPAPHKGSRLPITQVSHVVKADNNKAGLPAALS